MLNVLCAWIYRFCVGGDFALSQLWYFAVLVDLVFELTERVFIAVKVTSLDDAVRKEQRRQLRLIQPEIAPTLCAQSAILW